MAKMVEQWTSIHKVVGSTPTQINFWWLLSTLFEFFSFIHTFIKFNIHKVSPAVVAACFKNCFINQSPWCSAIPGFEPMPLLGPTKKLNCVWCTVELKVVGNLECRIKFYREKKPRHFFYTIEYLYPPTNSVEELTLLSNGLRTCAGIL